MNALTAPLTDAERAALAVEDAIDDAVMDELSREPKRPYDAWQRMYDRIEQEDPYGYEHRYVMRAR